MANMKFLNAAGKYSDPYAYEDVIGYILQPHKTPNRIVGGFNVDFTNPAQSMQDHTSRCKKDFGVRLRHFVVSFTKKDITSLATLQKVANHLGSIIGLTHQVVYAAHEDTQSLHIHYVFNSVGFFTGRKYHGSKSDHIELKQTIRNALRANGISVCYEVSYYPSRSHPHE